MNGNIIMGVICVILTGCFVYLGCNIYALAFGILSLVHTYFGVKELF